MYPNRLKTFSLKEQLFSSISLSPIKRQITNTISDDVLFHCHRGILIREKQNHDFCLCPPSYFGNRCEWQSERITLSFDSEILKSTVDSNVIYRMIFYLVNEYERRVLDFETLLYAPFIHSTLKHIIYLKYPREYLLRSPQNRQIERISIYVDAYIVTRTSVKYSISWYFPVLFPFLPVNRLAFRLSFQEPRDINRTRCSQLDCKNGGLCQTYINTDEIFCYCPLNFSGLTCEEQVKYENLQCHIHAQLIKRFNHTFCLCPFGRTGRNCLVKYDTCSNLSCYNNGTCIPGDDRTKQYICQCSKEYFGNHCEYRNAILHYSIRLVKIISPLIFLILILTLIHQLFSHHLITDPRNDARQWCVVKYRYEWLQTYDIVIKFIHSITPFLINLISVIILFVTCARKKQRIRDKVKYSIIFIKQVRQHKHLLISPFVTTAFKLPFLIVQVLFKCIIDKWQLHISLIAYFISNIPLAITFIIFVWFSPSYYKVFVKKCIRRFI
ncbi:hypothetical protein I4U23_010847 [Adineta vaga]|nr:hypothetical protein I4U23_010847 [Adineta vaga]